VKKQRLQHWILGADLIWTGVAMVVAYLLRFGFTWYGPPNGSFLTFLPPLLGAIGLWTIIFARMHLDGFRRGWYPPAILSQLFLAVSFLIIAVFAGGFIAQVYMSRLTLAYFGIFLFLGFVAVRYFAHAVLGSKLLTRASRRVLIVGSGPVARELASKIQRHPELLCQLVGFLCSADSSPDGRMPGSSQTAIPVQTLGVMDLLREQRIDEIIIALPKPGSAEVMNLAARCRQAGITVSVVPHHYELYLSKPQLLDIGGLPVLQLREATGSFGNAAWKRGLDVVLGSTLLFLSLPILLIAAVILLSKRGAPLRGELRCGQSGKLFRMWRLNSNRNGPDVSRSELVMQQLSITELPQLWNVLRGEMSLVGPRPESPERVKHYSDWQRERLQLKPGMTGLAQVHGLREQHSSEEKASFDLQYMLHPSPFLDISLLLQTLWTLTGRLLRLRKLGSGETGSSREITDRLFERSLSSAHRTQSSAD
jgi:lipopolysaccharide/colanic/teichoic acid biosynthesis glycosyltransferase